jgi:hypothetical protein
MKKIKIEQYIAFFSVVIAAVYMRLIPHIPNVSPIGALALFSGAMMPNIGGLLLPLASMIVSDIFLGFHNTMPYVYGSFIVIGGIGLLMHKRLSPFKVGIGSLTGSMLFFIITNFGVWMTSSMYEKNISGLLMAYGMGLPFFRNTLIGDLFYNVVFFMGYVLFLSLSKQVVIMVKRLVHYHLS